MEQYTPAFPIEVVCSPKAILCFLAFGFHEVERHDSGGTVRLHKPDGSEGDLDRIVALAQATFTPPVASNVKTQKSFSFEWWARQDSNL